MFDSIKTRLIALGVGIVALTLLAITVANYVTVRGHTHQQVSQSLDELAAARSDAIRQWVRSQRDIVASLQPAVAAADPVPLLQQAAKSGRLEAAYVGFADKKIVFNTPQNLPADYDPTRRPWYTGAAGASGAVLTAPYMDASKGRLVVTFAAADKGGGGTKAVIATDVFLDDVVATVQAIKPTPGGFAFLMSKDGKIVAHPDAKLALKDATAISEQLTPQALATALDPAAGWVEAAVGGDTFLVSGTPIADTDWQLFVAAKKDEALASLSALLRTAVITALVMMAVAALAMMGTISAMLRGVDRVRAALDDISAGDGDLTQRLPAGGRDEVGRIASSFNLFAEKIQRMLLDVRAAQQLDHDGFQRDRDRLAGPVSAHRGDGIQPAADGVVDGGADRDGAPDRRRGADGQPARVERLQRRGARRRGRRPGGLDHGRDHREFQEDQRHHRHHRRHRVPDQHPGAERGGGSRASRRAGPRLRRGRGRSTHAGAAQRRGGQGDQDADRRRASTSVEAGSRLVQAAGAVDERHRGQRAAGDRHHRRDHRRVRRAEQRHRRRSTTPSCSWTR